MKRLTLIAILVISVCCCAKEKPVAALHAVSSVYVSGNSEAAQEARERIQDGKTCFTLATKADEADATLELQADSQSQGGIFGMNGGRSWIVNGNLTSKSGELLWSKTEKFTDAPGRSGAKVAGRLLVSHMADAAECKARGK